MSIEATKKQLQASVIAVPPLARNQDGTVSRVENAKLIRHLEQAGIVNLLYGGNAVFYHIALSEYAETLGSLRDSVGANTNLIPSAGPSYGVMMDQAAILADLQFESAMVLPQRELADAAGIAKGIRRFAERFGRPIVLYIKFDRWLDAGLVDQLYRDGVIEWIKYAVVREDPTQDQYLRELLEVVPGSIMVSGIGEQPAIIHMRDFGLASFTSGCVCVNPRLSNAMLQNCLRDEWVEAGKLRAEFFELESLRNLISPIRVLHRAVSDAGIAMTGPISPLLSELSPEEVSKVAAAAKRLREF